MALCLLFFWRVAFGIAAWPLLNKSKATAAVVIVAIGPGRWAFFFFPLSRLFSPLAPKKKVKKQRGAQGAVCRGRAAAAEFETGRARCRRRHTRRPGRQSAAAVRRDHRRAFALGPPALASCTRAATRLLNGSVEKAHFSVGTRTRGALSSPACRSQDRCLCVCERVFFLFPCVSSGFFGVGT
nr:hypothetical protein [Pandoravirus belohorizontensis]